MHIPTDLYYSKSHEWLRLDNDNQVTIGITEHAQGLLGDVVFIELPEIDSNVDAQAETGVIESVKAAADIYAPIAGQIIAVNADLAAQPELVNQEPYGAGWIYRLQIDDKQALAQLMNAEAYQQHIAD